MADKDHPVWIDVTFQIGYGSDQIQTMSYREEGMTTIDATDVRHAFDNAVKELRRLQASRQFNKDQRHGRS